MTTMKILFVTPYLPSPPRFGAQRRLDGLMRGLAARHEVSLLSFVSPSDALEEARRETARYCKTIETLENDAFNMSVRTKRVTQLQSMLSPHSFEHRLWHDLHFQSRLDRLQREFDVVQVEFSQLGIYRFPPRAQRRAVFVLDEHNIEYDLIKRTAETEGTLARRLYSAVDWRKLKHEERDTWRRFDGVALTSARDEEVLRESEPATRTVVVPNAVDLESFKGSGAQREPATLMFFGAMNYHPNIEGVQYFVREILPLVVAEVPNVKLLVVGQQPPDAVRALASEHVEIVGFVDDPRTVIDRASALVVPLRIGGGTRFKIVEGMAMSAPIISTYIGAEGIEAEHDKHLLLARDAQSFARETIRLLKDPELGRRLGREARRLAEERYGWAQAVRTLEDFYDRLGARNGG